MTKRRSRFAAASSIRVSESAGVTKQASSPPSEEAQHAAAVPAPVLCPVSNPCGAERLTPPLQSSFRIAPAKRKHGPPARRRYRSAVGSGLTGDVPNGSSPLNPFREPMSHEPWDSLGGTVGRPQDLLNDEKDSAIEADSGSLLRREKRPRLSSEFSPPPRTMQTSRPTSSRVDQLDALSSVDAGLEASKGDGEGSQPVQEPEFDPLEDYMRGVSADASRSVGRIASSVASGVDARDVEPEDDEGHGFLAGGSDGGFLDRSKRKRPVYDRVDHSRIEYIPFQKNLYREVPELARMMPEEVRQARRALGNVRIRGRKCPAPIRSFGQCGLSAAVLDVLTSSGYTAPTPIQAQAIPCIMSGRDVIGVAKTGSGKTLAFLLPVLRHVAIQDRPAPGEGPVALLVAPTRELAIQIYGEAKRFGRVVNLRCVCAYGGSGLKDQITDLKRGADIVVCTPGRMIDLLAMNSGRVTNLRRVTIVVLDEADRMFDMGFEPQLTRLVENVRPDRQTLMFSATFPPQVEKLARKVLGKPIEIVIGGNSVAATSIAQHVEVRPEESKFFRLLQLLGDWYEQGSTLVFVDRQDNADRIFRELSQAGYLCLSLHGGMDQADRDSAIADFKNGDVRVLIATSVAARGLDVKNLSLVINFDVPNHYEDYVHRVGRTGRAGRCGTAYTFLTPEQEMFAADMVKALELSAKSAVNRQGLSKEEADRQADEAAAVAVPGPLRELAASFAAKQEVKRRSGIAVRGSNSGYGGRGFTFEENEESAQASLRKSQARRFKREAGVEGDDIGDESDSDEPEVSKDGASEVKVIRRSSKGQRAAGDGAPGEPTAPADGEVALQKAIQAAEEAALAQARQGGLDEAATASRVVVARTNVLVAHRAKVARLQSSSDGGGPARRSEEPLHGGGNEVEAQGTGGTALSAAAAAAAALSARISGSSRGEQDSRGSRPGAATGSNNMQNGGNLESDSIFEAELEINDYPQHARWRVTHANALDDVTENTGCVATTRGNFYPPGRNPPAGERKLHLLIEGPSEMAVRSAFKEIKLRLEEAAEARPDDRGAYSKYSVV